MLIKYYDEEGKFIKEGIPITRQETLDIAHQIIIRAEEGRKGYDYCNSEEPNHVRVDFFKPSGKWYTTEEMIWPDNLYMCKIEQLDGSTKINLLHDAFKEALNQHLKRPRLYDMWVICLEPYHEYSYPIMMKVSDIYEAPKEYKKLEIK